MSSCSFSYTDPDTAVVTTKTIRVHVKPMDYPSLDREVVGRSGGGRMWVYTRGATERQFKLRFERLTNTEKTDLETFITSTLPTRKGSQFTYTDPSGTAYTLVQFLTFDQWFQQTQPGRWSFAATLVQPPAL